MTDPSTSSHQSQPLQASTLAVTRSNNSTLSIYVDERTPVLLQQTAITVVYSKNKPVVPMKARLILDSGSQKSVVHISADLRDELKLPSEQSVTLSIKIFGSETEMMQKCDVVELGLKTILGLYLKLSTNVYAIPFIYEPVFGQPIDIAVERFQYVWIGPCRSR